MTDEATLKLFGEQVRIKRQENGLSQEALAFQCGLDRTYIGGIERGERNVSILNIIKISNALKIGPSELFKIFD